MNGPTTRFEWDTKTSNLFLVVVIEHSIYMLTKYTHNIIPIDSPVAGRGPIRKIQFPVCALRWVRVTRSPYSVWAPQKKCLWLFINTYLNYTWRWDWNRARAQREKCPSPTQIPYRCNFTIKSLIQLNHSDHGRALSARSQPHTLYK
jgi:hypothetical protein